MGRRIGLFLLDYPFKDTMNLDLLFNFIVFLRNETCTVNKVVYTGSASSCFSLSLVDYRVLVHSKWKT